jgi:ubiquinone/menaquinone biosynthesis C-methylase UbiE/uncharacterized protein YbaR (Trm112 family)
LKELISGAAPQMKAQLKISEKQSYPQNLLPSLREVPFFCPLCKGELMVLANGYSCKSCSKEYLLHDGIPDFRVFPDPYLDFQEDFKRTEIVLKVLDKFDLEKLLEYYWSFSDITPEDLRPKFIRSAKLGEVRARRTLEVVENAVFIKDFKPKRVLEIGSGTGNFLAVASERFGEVIGIDIAMRWLHVSRRRFMDLGLPVPPLVCCCAENLPFADNAFDLVVATSTLEFVKDQAKVLSECARALTTSGFLYINSVNRYALARDPYAYLWGVGFLPRKWQEKYVRWRRNATYRTRTFSYREINCLASQEFGERKFLLPDISPTVVKDFSRFTRSQVNIYLVLKKLPLFSTLLKQIGPGWDVVLRKTPFSGENL